MLYMRFIPTKLHGCLDYIVGALVIAMPWLFGFAKGGAETTVTVIFGVIAIVYSLLTNYELGVVPVLSMPTHLLIDFFWGLALAASPWLFGFANDTYLPQLIIGLFAIVASLLTRRVPQTKGVQNVSAIS